MTTFVAAPKLEEPIGPEWRTWGPYLSDRQWGTVREDYSDFGTAWDYFPHDHARSRVYRWGEDGLLGISDEQQRLCFAVALWNGADPILKERLFGLTGSEGNHGEDVKEYYWYLDATPTHSYLKGLYKYPQRPYPYGELVDENRRRGREAPEYELIDTGVFAEDRYFDVEVEYAKVGPTDTLIRITATNRGPDPAPLHVLPTLWFRNTWAWGRDDRRPELRAVPRSSGSARTNARGGPLVQATHPDLEDYWLVCQGSPTLLFTENETNAQRLWGGANRTPYVKDGIEAAIIGGHSGAVNPGEVGTKVAALYRLDLAPGASETVLLRLASDRYPAPFGDAAEVFADRIAEADALYASLSGGRLPEDEARVQRQALAGLIWSKQTYLFDVAAWLDGDPGAPPPPAARRNGRNSQWRHHNSNDVISMPDKWEYPWYAAWDLAFHCVAFNLVDPGFAKDQLLLMLREWYMHPNGQLPAYEWAFGDVNPPVHIAAARAIYQDERQRTGTGDRDFLVRIFHKLLLNFTWWVNRKDEGGRNLFQGGFLGLDNISVIDRSSGVPEDLTLEQADGTAWMASYCLNMAWTALQLTLEDPAYEDLAIKFLEHYLAIGGAMNGLSDPEGSLWDEEDGFYYDFIRRDDGVRIPLKLRSLVGLLPICPAIGLTQAEMIRLREAAPAFIQHMQRYAERHPELASLFPEKAFANGEQRRVLTLVPEERLRRVLARMFDPAEFLSDFGIRSLSRHYLDHPYELQARGQSLRVSYEPAESSSGMFGGNSNWRGPIWMPVNLLLVAGLRNLYGCYGDEFQVEYPTGSGQHLTLAQIADDLSRRLSALFLRGPDGRRPVFGWTEVMQTDPHWHDHLLFYEYFHGDNGAGIGASHQTGWTAVIANLIDRTAADVASEKKSPALVKR
jgi:hypothetical protein